MSHTLTQKVTIFTFALTALFVLSLALPTGADAKTRAERAKEKRDVKMASSTKERSERERSPNSSSTRPEQTASSTDNRGNGKNIDATCMQGAIDTREASLVSAWDKFSASMKSALAARKTALYTAWGMSDTSARNTALKDAWKAARDSSKNAHGTLKSDRKAAWDTFKTTAKSTCKASVPKEESLDKDVSGSISL